ncbi:hypothetical protein SASPL_133951 [Salvia splendens]|uniref:Methyltransferase small domain-containing protein n=1 Tax=Salvia splendens TaxID=180675 RepID=A0A8X8X6N4_SALSN|nr:hypothetical protein SASPL_133951 [Salvia splendens]
MSSYCRFPEEEETYNDGDTRHLNTRGLVLHFLWGLNRHPDSIFKDRTVAELGCGNGWISIAIAEKWLPSKVYGLDINPRAVKISWINLYLNALDDSGKPIYDVENKTLLDRVEFYESDLLSYCRNNNIELERIVGCIPQILNPNSDAMSKMITENASEEFLHSLSNYCALQVTCYINQFVQEQHGHMGLQFLRNGLDDIRSSLDLSFEEDSVADEKIPFLAHLANVLKQLSFFPCEPPALIPRLAIVDEQLSRHLPKQWLTTLKIVEKTETGENSHEVITVIEAPRQSDLMVDLIKKLRPEVVVTGMGQFESVTSSAFEHLLDTTREIGCRLFVDISDHFVLSSLPSSNGVLKYLARSILPPHATVVCGLLNNQVYKDLEVAFVISENEEMFKALCRTVELLQGSTAIISQYYYGFVQSMSFWLFSLRIDTLGHRLLCATKVNGVSSLTYPVLDHAELSINESDESSLVHRVVDQSFLPITTPVKAAIYESFARQNITESETDVTDGIRRLVSSSYGFSCNSSTEFIYAGSPVELFTNLVNCCVQEGGTLCFPSGSNGNYVSAARFLKANIVTIATSPKVGNQEINKLLSVCAKFGARIILDTSFSGVRYNPKGFDGWNLGATLEKLSSANPATSVCLLGGLFFKMLASGLKFGFLLMNQPSLVDAFHSSGGVSKPHSTIKYTVKKLLESGEQETQDLLNGIAEQMENLRSRFKSLKQVLDAEAGVSMVAKPSAYLGKTIKLNGVSGSRETKLDDTNIRDALLSSTRFVHQ